MKKYIDLYYPIENCNFNCEYCYVHEHRDNLNKKYVCSHSAEEIRHALSCKRLGGKCLINICAGGETLLYPEIFDIIKQLLIEGHYVSVVTNGTITKNIKLIENFDKSLRKHLFFKFSFHYDELKKRNMLDLFFNNIRYVKEKECSYTVELPAYDRFLEYKNEIINLCKKELDNEVCHVTALRDEKKSDFALLSKYDYKDYKEQWKVFHSKLFNIRSEVIEKKYKGFCYAGDWTFTADIESGDIKQCYYERVLDNLYESPNEKLNLCAVGNHCHSEYCYACHAFLCLGDIPELDINERYDETRDRNKKWLTEDMRNFMHQTLSENNKIYSEIVKRHVNNDNAQAERSCYNSVEEYLKKIICDMKELTNANNYALVQARHDTKMMYEEIPSELTWIYRNIPEEKCIDGDRIIIESLGNSNKKASGNEIWIVGAFIDNIWYAAECIFDKTWIHKNRMIGWNEYTTNLPQNVWGCLPKYENCTLVFEKNKWRGKCKIEFNGIEKIVDTFGDCDNDILYVEL